MPVNAIAWPFTVVDSEHVSPVTITMSALAGSHTHPSGPASGFVLQHTGGPESCLGVPPPPVGTTQPAAARSANRRTIEERIAELYQLAGSCSYAGLKGVRHTLVGPPPSNGSHSRSQRSSAIESVATKRAAHTPPEARSQRGPTLPSLP